MEDLLSKRISCGHFIAQPKIPQTHKHVILPADFAQKIKKNNLKVFDTS